MDLPQSDDCFVMAFPAETTEAFLEGHNHCTSPKFIRIAQAGFAQE